MYPRYIKLKVYEALADTPVVCLLGPRQSGKTTLVRQICPQRTYVNLDDTTLADLAKQDPLGFINSLSEKVIIDEIQRVPELMLAIKASIDSVRKPGQFLLTGSANLLLLPNIQDSLAGRMEVIELSPLAEQEKQRSETSFLQKLITGQIKPQVTGEQQVVSGIADVICQGGYPEPNTRRSSRARQWHRQYVKAIVQRDVKDIANIRDEDDMLAIIEILAHRTATLLNVNSIANELSIRRETVEKYISILERLFLIRRLPAWHRNQAKRLIKTPKVHMIDSGLATTLSYVDKQDWLQKSTEFGHLLESFVVQQIICQASWLDNDFKFSHYRDKDKIEVDLVIESGGKVWGVEVKKSATIQEKDGVGLKRLAQQADSKFKQGILLYTGSNYMKLDNNTLAVPISALW